MNRQAYSITAAEAILEAHASKPERLVQILADFIKRFGWVPGNAVPLIADALNLSRADVHGVVSYYHDFRATPPGKHVLKICQAEACQAVGARELTKAAERIAGLEMGKDSDALSVEPAYCLGNCALGPAAMFDGKTLGRVDATLLERLLADVTESVS